MLVLIVTCKHNFWSPKVNLLDRRQPGPIKSVLLVMVGWLVGNVVFSETTLKNFSDFLHEVWVL